MGGTRNKRKAKLTRAQIRARIEASRDAGAAGAGSRKRRAETELERHDAGEAEEDSYAREHIASGERTGAQLRGAMMTVNGAVVFRAGRDAVARGEEMVYDESAYDQFHRCSLEWPALSFDFACRDGSSGRYDNSYAVVEMQKTYPMEVTLVVGTQADVSWRNRLVCLRVSNMQRSRRGRRRRAAAAQVGVKRVGAGGEWSSSSDSDSDSDSEEESEEESGAVGRQVVLQNVDIKFDSIVNRVRTMPQQANMVAAWGSSGRVQITDVRRALDALHSGRGGGGRGGRAAGTGAAWSMKAAHVFSGHGAEGYALDWSRTEAGALLSGAQNGRIHVTSAAGSDGGAAFATEPRAFDGHDGSVEDVQWSPVERSVFASCGGDGSVRIWDARARARRCALAVRRAHASDVNVIAWNAVETQLVASGGDDAAIRVWDLRQVGGGGGGGGGQAAAAELRAHSDAVSCVQWHATQRSMLCAGSEDGCVSVWDLAVERDVEEELRCGMVVGGAGAEELPAQLLFSHMGQRHVKEARWEPTGGRLIVSSGADGLHLFEAANV